jgi:hypothetical protein
MTAMRASYGAMAPGTTTTEADLSRMRLRRQIDTADTGVRETKRRLTAMEHERSVAVSELRTERGAAAAAVGAREGMRAPDLVGEFTRAPWWTAPKPDASVKSDSRVAARIREIAKRKRRSGGLPSWAKPSASDEQFQRGLAEISSKIAVLSARNSLAAYIDAPSTDEQGTELYLKMSARYRVLESLFKKFDTDQDWRQMSALARSAKKPKPKKKRRPTRSPSPTGDTKRGKAASGAKIVKEGEHDTPAEGFDSRFFV